MPKEDDAGIILVGSSDKAMISALEGFLAENFGKKVISVKETSDLLLEILDKRIDLTIIDVALSGLPTAQTIQIFKKKKPAVPVIVITDDYSVETGSRIAEQGVFYYLYKPLELNLLKDIVQSALKKRAREESYERR